MHHLDAEELTTWFAANLRRIRTEQGISQQTLGDLVDISPGYISDLERARLREDGQKVRGVSLATLAKLADALGVMPSTLISMPPNANLGPRHPKLQNPEQRNGRATG